MALTTLEIVYIAASIALVTSGLTMVGFAVRAYFRTTERAMIFLSVGFSLIVAAAIATTFSAFLTGLQELMLPLTANYVITTIGYLFIIYSVIVAAR